MPLPLVAMICIVILVLFLLTRDWKSKDCFSGLISQKLKEMGYSNKERKKTLEEAELLLRKAQMYIPSYNPLFKADYNKSRKEVVEDMSRGRQSAERHIEGSVLPNWIKEIVRKVLDHKIPEW